MGMFDEVCFSCPKCDVPLRVQSKAGDCCLRDYPSREVPVGIAHDIRGEEIWCEGCAQTYRVVIDSLPPTTVRCYLVRD